MIDSLLADLVVVLHLLFILFVLAGGLLLFRWPRLIWLHLPAVLWAVWIEFAGWLCPLTPLENQLRLGAGREVYETSFIEEYLLPLIYPATLTRNSQILLGILLLSLNLGIYAALLRRRSKKSGS